ncbi:MAG: PASTA domain-containing protein [Prevotella sp.]|jgi:beta-lactam-binding protein with PASTA domain
MIAKKFFKKFVSGYLWLNFLGMIVVLALLFFGLKTWLHAYTHNGEKIEVPDLYGMDFRKAMHVLGEKGLAIFANDSTYIKELPAGCVVVQSPEKGMSVKEGRTVYVTINSLTIPRVRIPDLIDNCSYREAQVRLQQLEFRLLPPKLIDGEQDWVYGIQWEGRNVQAGDLVARESQLTLVIGNGAFGEDYSEEDTGEEGAASENPEFDPEEWTGPDEIDDFLPVDLGDGTE